jgi:RNA 3'-terminal phosphate cyclase (ATP)
MIPILDIDGAYGEGGGQVLRTALTLSVLTKKSVRIYNIRTGRKNPGLAPQHLTNVLALAQICNAEVKGAKIGSTEVVFQPQSPPRADHYIFDVAETAQRGSAGSVTLILQTLLLPLTYAEGESHLILKGGTNVPWSPPFEFLAQVYLPLVEQMGIKAACKLQSRGFYPIGGGQLEAKIKGMARTNAGAAPRLRPLSLHQRGDLRTLRGEAIGCKLPAHIPQRMADRARKLLTNAALRNEITPKVERGVAPGAFLFLMAEYEHAIAGFSALGARGKSSERVAEEACEALLAHHEQGAPVEKHLADQLLLPMALASGHSEFRTSCVTRHLLTNAHVIRQLIPAEIEIEGEEGAVGSVVVDGATL